MAGALRALGVELDEAERIVGEAARCAGDARTNDRRVECHSTYSKSADEPTAGLGRLAEMASGKALAETLRKLWGQERAEKAVKKTDTAVEQLNERHAVISS